MPVLPILWREIPSFSGQFLQRCSRRQSRGLNRPLKEKTTFSPVKVMLSSGGPNWSLNWQLIFFY